jgi:hypothetical protein
VDPSHLTDCGSGYIQYFHWDLDAFSMCIVPLCTRMPVLWIRDILVLWRFRFSLANLQQRVAGSPPNLLARKTRHFNSRLACQRSPLPCSKSPGKTRSAIPPPPPPAAPPTEQGEGAGSRPGPPTHLEQVLLLSFPFS